MNRYLILIFFVLFLPIFGFSQYKYIFDSPLAADIHGKTLVIKKLKEMGLSSDDDLKKFISQLDSAIQIQKHAALYYEKGRCLYLLDKYEEALVNFTRASLLEPKLYLAFKGKGDAKKSLNDYYGAIVDYTAALEIKTSNNDSEDKDEFVLVQLYGSRGQSLAVIGKYEEAIDELTKAIERVGKDDFTHLGFYYYLRGLSYVGLDSKKSGCEDLSKAIEYGDTRALEMIKSYCNE